MDFTQDALNCVAYCDLEERVFDSTDYGCEIVAMIFTGDAQGLPQLSIQNVLKMDPELVDFVAAGAIAVSCGSICRTVIYRHSSR